jgi:hypothetical protein
MQQHMCAAVQQKLELDHTSDGLTLVHEVDHFIDLGEIVELMRDVLFHFDLAVHVLVNDAGQLASALGATN